MCNKGTGVFMPLVCREACKQGSPERSEGGAPLPNASPRPDNNAGPTPPNPPCSRRVSSTNSHARCSADRTTQCCSQQSAAAPARRSTFPGAGSHPPTSPEPRRHSSDSPYGSSGGCGSRSSCGSGGGCGRGPSTAELPRGSSSCRSSPLPTAAFRQPQHSSPGAAGYGDSQQGGGDAVLWDSSGTTRSRSSPLPALPQQHLQQQHGHMPQGEASAALAGSSVPSRDLSAMAGAAKRQLACSSTPFDSATDATRDVMTFSTEVGVALSPRPSSGLSWGGTAAPAGDWADWSGPLTSPPAAAGIGIGSSGSGSSQQSQAHGVAATVAQLKMRLEQAGAAATAQGGLSAVGSNASTFGSLMVGSIAGGEGMGDGSSSALAQSRLGQQSPLPSSMLGRASANLNTLLQHHLQLLQLEQQHLRRLELQQQCLQHPSSLQQQQSLAYDPSGWPAAAVPCASASLLPASAGPAVHAALPTPSLSAHVALGQGGGVGADLGDGCVGEGGVDVASLAAAAAQQKLAELQQLEELQQQLLGEVMTLLPLI